MDMSGIDNRTLKEYRALETELHRELMKWLKNTKRSYIKRYHARKTQT